MKFYSPLRYPGGKNKLAKFIARVCEDNNIDGCYVEPYAGGASVGLFLLLEKYVSKIIINDADPSIYAFWCSILNYTEEFCDLVRKTEVNIQNWQKCKQVQERKETANLLELGFSTFFLNRTNRSGIINAGVIGGLEQKGKYKMNCRFNKKNLIKRIEVIASHKKDIKACKKDALDLVDDLQKKHQDSDTIFYFDPPYYSKGELLYLNHYKPQHHEKVSRKIKKIKNFKWIISYDNRPEIKRLYKGKKKIEYSFYHTAHTVKKGKEVLFFSNNLSIPKVKNPTKVKI